MKNLNNDADTNNKTDSSLYHIQQIAKLVARLNLSKSEREAFLDQVFEEVWADCFQNAKKEKGNCHQGSDGDPRSNNPRSQGHHHVNPDLTSHYKLDWLFHKPITELVKLSFHDLYKKQERAQLLVEWLGSVIQMKKKGE